MRPRHQPDLGRTHLAQGAFGLRELDLVGCAFAPDANDRPWCAGRDRVAIDALGIHEQHDAIEVLESLGRVCAVAQHVKRFERHAQKLRPFTDGCKIADGSGVVVHHPRVLVLTVELQRLGTGGGLAAEYGLPAGA